MIISPCVMKPFGFAKKEVSQKLVLYLELIASPFNVLENTLVFIAFRQI